ncbi:MAG: hypothetical protein IKV90_11275 [Clostridia bacterium]|nr:hypothetical protein [Clostridia bacterium]
MTAFMIFASLIIANVLFMIDDSRRTETARLVDDFYRVENGCVLRDELV